MEWKRKAIDKVDKKIKTLSNKISSKFHRSLLLHKNLLNTLNDIYNQFVVTTIDKDTENVVFICQQFYALVQIKELGLDHNNTNTNKNYLPVHKTNNQVVSRKTIFLRNTFNLLVHEQNKELPNIHWSPKLHKHCSKGKSIIAVPQVLLNLYLKL